MTVYWGLLLTGKYSGGQSHGGEKYAPPWAAGPNSKKLGFGAVQEVSEPLSPLNGST